MNSRFRKLLHLLHIAFSVGWLGSVMAYLALAISGRTSDDAELARSAYFSMETIGWFVVMPLCLGSLSTGVLQSLLTEWGLFRHYWVSIKFFITVFATAILLGHLPKVIRVANAAREGALFESDFATDRMSLIVHASGGIVVILAALVLSIYKPFGKMKYGKNKMRRAEPSENAEKPARKIGWQTIIIIFVALLLVAIILMHLVTGGMPSH